MARSFPTEVITAVTQPSTAMVVLALVRVRYGNNVLQLVNNTQPVTRMKDGIWQAYPFSVILPSDGNDEIPILDVTAANVDLQVTEFAKQVAGQDSHALCDLYIIDYQNPDAALLAYESYEVRDIKYDETTISFELKLHTTLEEEFSRWRFRPSVFPALF